MMKSKILIVDDEHGIVDMIQSYFQKQYDILTAYSQGFHNKTKRIRRYSKWHVNMTMNTKYRQ